MRSLVHTAKSLRRNFSKHNGGGASVQAAMLFGAIGMAMAVLAAPMLQGAVDYYADNRAFGLDRVMTGSVEKGNRYTVRKSVLAEDTTTTCDGKDKSNCKKQ